MSNLAGLLRQTNIPRLDAEILMLEVLGREERTFLVAHAEEEMTTEQEQKFLGMVRRREAGEPVAYILGWKEFFGREFLVNKNVLIPRAETERLVERAIALIDAGLVRAVQDVGTGSGCVGISVKLERPETVVTVSDISEAALNMAAKNADRLGAEVRFEVRDLLEPMGESGAESDSSELAEKLVMVPGLAEGSGMVSELINEFEAKPDIVVANLPYVDENWEWLDRDSLSYEPKSALYAEDGGLALIKKLIRQASGAGVRYLLLEADPCQHAEIVRYAEENGYNKPDASETEETLTPKGQDFSLLFELEVV